MMNYDTLRNPGYCSNGNKHTYKVIDKDGTAECTKCGLRNSFTQTNKI